MYVLRRPNNVGCVLLPWRTVLQNKIQNTVDREFVCDREDETNPGLPHQAYMLHRPNDIVCVLSPRRIVLQNQIDQLFLAIEKRPPAPPMGLEDGDVTLRVHADDGMGFKIHVVGDSTMRVRGVLLINDNTGKLLTPCKQHPRFLRTILLGVSVGDQNPCGRGQHHEGKKCCFSLADDAPKMLSEPPHLKSSKFYTPLKPRPCER